MTGQHPELLKQWVLNPPTPSVEIRLPRQETEESAVGKGFEVALGKFWLNPDTHKWVRWDERYLVVYSQNFAQAEIVGLEQRIEKATAALSKLAAKPGDDIEQLWVKVAAILKRHRVKEFFAVEATTETITQNRYVGRGRPTATSQQEQITRRLIQVNIQSQSAAIEQARQLAGWRL
jgi:hypothetical protein